MTGEITLKAISKAPNLQGRNKVLTGQHLQDAEEEEALVEGLAPNQKGCFVYSVEKTKDIQQGRVK